MAKPYLQNLSQMVRGLDLPFPGVTLENKHFFSGAALYADGNICATLSPAGFALKLPEDTRQKLIESSQGSEFRFFPTGPIKHAYVALSESLLQDEEALRELLRESIAYVLDREASDDAAAI